jgi:hypothetical protein
LPQRGDRSGGGRTVLYPPSVKTWSEFCKQLVNP